MSQLSLNNISLNGENFKIIHISQLTKIKNNIDQFKQVEELNNFQKWIVNDLYKFDIPIAEFLIRSIILIAIPHPFYAHVEFLNNGQKYTFLSLVMSDFEKTEKELKQKLQAEKYNIIPAQNLPLKRLAVQSGLAVYGRNNICYINGLGSNFSLVAYYSDILCSDKYWTDVSMASICIKCNACLSNCPTGAIQKNRFLIDNEKCLSYWNESALPFPEWIPKSAHHCVYDCLKCQIYCPMNKEQIKNIVEPIQFTEIETNMLLSGLQYEQQSASLKQKVKYLGLHQYPNGISRNLKLLFELFDNTQ